MDTLQKVATGKLIVAVDDDPGILRAIRAVVNMMGHHVVTLDSADLAVELLRQNECDLVISDVMMPDMNGWDFFRRIRDLKLHGRTPAIFLTATVRSEEESHFSQGVGRCRVIAKPIEASRLMAAIEEMVQGED